MAPHINRALDERSVIKQAIDRYGTRSFYLKGGVEATKAAGDYVIGGNRKAIGRLQKIKESFK